MHNELITASLTLAYLALIVVLCFGAAALLWVDRTCRRWRKGG